jgi:hypothetical protein
MSVSKMTARDNPELSRVTISASRMEFSEVVSSIGPRVHERAKGNGFGGNMRKDVKGMGGDDIREVRDYGNAVPGMGSLVCRSVSGQGSMRKSRGRVRM